MEKTRMGLLIARVLQIIFGAVVLGVSAKLAIDLTDARSECKKYGDKDADCSLANRPITATEYAAFTGAWGLLDALIGLVAVFVAAVPWIVTAATGTLAAIFYLAGGINSAVYTSTYIYKKLLDSNFHTRFDTSIAFMFLGLIASLVTIALIFIGRRSGSIGHSAV